MLRSQRLDHMTKTSLFSTISFAAILLILFVGTIFSNLFLHSFVLIKTNNLRVHVESGLLSKRFSSSTQHLLSMKEEVDDQESILQDQNSLLPPPPLNVTEEERINWFRTILPKLEIFRSSNGLSRRFDDRARKFFNMGCEVHFFMTWVSPARSFRQREFFGLESLFKAHPHGCLMILSWTMDTQYGSRILKPLRDRGFKVVAMTPNFKFLLDGTPASTWFDEMMKGNKDPGEIPLGQNLSNLLRLVVLYKYGGIYMDTDFVLLKKISGLRNSIGAQSMDETGNWTRLNNAVLVFEKNHPILFKFIVEFSLTFDGNKWGHNGPYLVSRVVNRIAAAGKSPAAYNFTILPPMAFYPVSWNRIGGFFRGPDTPAMSKWIAAKLLQLSGETYGIHLWNRQSSRLGIEEGSIMGRLISDHCVLCEDTYFV